MAISEERLGYDSLVSASQINYSTASDTAALTESKSLSDAYTAAQLNTSLNSSGTSSKGSILDNAFGNFSLDNCGNSGLPSYLRNGNYYDGMLRNLGYGGNNAVCSKQRSSNPFDSALGNVNNIGQLGNFKLGIPAVRENMMDSMITSQAKSYLGDAGGLISIPMCLITDVKRGLLSGLNKIGSSLSSKLSIANLFNLKLSSCMSKALATAGNNNTVGKLTSSSLINNYSAMDNSSAATTLSGMVNSGSISNNTLLSGFSHTLSNGSDNNVENKLYLLNSVQKNVEDKSLTSIYTKGNSENVLNNLNESNYISNSPSSDYKQVTQALDYVDASWDKDNTGSTNLYRSVGNKRLTTLAAATVNSNVVTDTSGEYTTNLDRASEIYILNSFAS